MIIFCLVRLQSEHLAQCCKPLELSVGILRNVSSAGSGKLKAHNDPVRGMLFFGKYCGKEEWIWWMGEHTEKESHSKIKCFQTTQIGQLHSLFSHKMRLCSNKVKTRLKLQCHVISWTNTQSFCFVLVFIMVPGTRSVRRLFDLSVLRQHFVKKLRKFSANLWT